jgi:pimeloyl-ACP methyl ester carboxylesterase
LRAFNFDPERVSWRERTPLDVERWQLVVKIMGPEHDGDLQARLGEISVPTLVLFGVEDGIFPPAGAAIYRDSVPHCACVLLENTAHDIQGDQPQLCAQLVSEFLADGGGFTASHHDLRLTP